MYSLTRPTATCRQSQYWDATSFSGRISTRLWLAEVHTFLYFELRMSVTRTVCCIHSSQSQIAGEHSVVMLHPLQSALVEGTAWLDPFVQDFRARFMTLLAGAFRHFTPGLALSLIHPQLTFSEAETQKSVSKPASVRKADGSLLTAYDLKRLQVGPASLVLCLIGLTLLRSRRESVS